MLTRLQARNEDSARRTAVAMCLVAALVTLGSALAVPPDGRLAQVIVLGWPPVLIGLGVSMFLPSARVRTAAITTGPFLGVLAVLGLDLLTRDASAAAQVSFCLPVLLAAYHYRVLAAALVSLLAVVGNAFVVLTIRPGVDGVLDITYMTMVLGLMTGLLVISAQRQDRLVSMLRAQADIDALTGLVSRRVLDEATRRVLARPGDLGAALLVVDIDHFKGINDTYGHLVGDDALIHVGALLGPVSVSGEAVVARMGGDELAALLPGCSCDDALRAAEAFVRRVRSSPLERLDGSPVPLTVSVGVAHTATVATLREVYGAADTSLYGAKRAGRDCVGAPITLPSPFAVPTPRAEAAGAPPHEGRRER